MKVYSSREGAIAARFCAALRSELVGARRLDNLVLFSIRGDERLPDSLDAVLRTLTGQRTAFVVFGDYSRTPDTSHPVAHGLLEWAKPKGDQWIAWVDTPVQDESGAAAKIAVWATEEADGALIVEPPLPLSEDAVFEAVRLRLGQGSILDFSDRANYDRSLWGRLSPKGAKEVAALVSADKDIDVLNMGWVAPDPPMLVLPPRLRVFRARGLTSVDGWLGAEPLLEELVLVGGALSCLKIPKRTVGTLHRVVLDKNTIAELTRGVADAPLTILSVYRNHLNRVPDEIAKLSQLESLTLGANPLTTLPHWLAELPRLAAIDLSVLQLDSASGVLINMLRERGVILRIRKATLDGSPIPMTGVEAAFPRLPSIP